MRIPRSLAWVLIFAGFFTAGLLRSQYLGTPRSPWVPGPVGSLLFACLLFLLLVSARERRVGAAPGPGVRLGSITPILLILLLEKWASLNLYRPLFAWLVGSRPIGEETLDAYWRAFAGAGLLAVTLVAAGLSLPAGRRTWKRANARRLLPGISLALAAVGVTYLALAALAAWRIGAVRLAVVASPSHATWIAVGQGVLAFAEEIYYRGLVLHEVHRLTPRLGLRAAGARRWAALLLSSGLFAIEHLSGALDPATLLRESVFSLALGLLFGLLVLLTENLWISATLHAWINMLLLGVAPRLTVENGLPAFAPAVYVAVALTTTIGLAAWTAARRPPGSD